MTTAPTIDRSIRSAGAVDLDDVAVTVAAAFLDDPVTHWLLPNETQRVQLAGPLFRLYVEPYLSHRETYLTSDGAGAAVWLPPGAELFTAAQEERFGQQLEELVGDDIVRFGQLAEVFAEHHPTEPLWYCQFLATVPAFQSQGIGSALLRDVLQRADRDGVPAYHEATTPRNRALYERHGYVNQGEFRLPDGPPLWRMWRDPR
jgi:GNAT superfamily N-acetyltransferase